MKMTLNGNELVFTNQNPMLFMVTLIPSEKKAIFNAGSHVYFHANSGLIVSNNASLNINGSKSNSTLFENEVVFESDRLQPEYRCSRTMGDHMAQMEAQIIPSTI
jgi:hypothetical protein